MRVLTLLLLVLTTSPGWAQAPGIPNPSFEAGKEAPEGWSLSGGKGAWEKEGRTGARCLSLSGDGKESQFWRCDSWRPKPGQAYRLTFWARAEGAGGGCLVSGLNSVNLDFPLPNTWQRYTRVFIAPHSPGETFLRLGHWNSTGKLFLDDVDVSPVIALNGVPGETVLGDGERIQGGRYRFQAPFSGDGANYARVLADFNAGFNTHRWVMAQGSYVTYRHRVGALRQRDGAVEVSIGYHVAGKLIVEAGKDGQTWQPVGEIDAKTTRRFSLPAELFPAEEIWIRLRGVGEQRSGKDSHPGSFQVYAYTYEAALDGAPKDSLGRTTFLQVTRDAGPARVSVETLGGLRPGQEPVARLRVTNPGTAPAALEAFLTLTPEGGKPSVFRAKAAVPAGKTAPLAIPYALEGAGAWQAALSVRAGAREVFAGSTEFTVPALYAADFGSLVSRDATAAVWWAEGTHKVSRERPAPTTRQPEVRIAAARHEYEPFQVVIRPTRALSGVTAEVEDFVGAGGARISRENARICLVHYVNVSRPTDRVGAVGAWPDPLPPYEGPFAVGAGANQPLWVTVYVPAHAAPGEYTSHLRLKAGAWRQEVPIRLRVWNFTLPKETHVRTAFGLSTGEVRRYHNLETPAELAQVMDRYYQNFAAHRISPYNAMELAPIKVSFGGAAWNGGTRSTERPLEGTHCLKVVDESSTASVGASLAERIPVTPGEEYRLSWAARTEVAGQGYQVTVQCYDAGGQWLSGRNVDLRPTGNPEWKRESASLKGRLPAEARSVSIILRPVRWSEDGKATGTAYFDAVSLRRAPDGPELAPDGGFEAVVDPSQVKVDFTAFDKAAHRAFNELGFNSFRLGIQGMGGGTFHSRHAGSIGGYAAGTPEYEVLFTAYVRQLQDHLEEKGWLDKAYVYWFDEPEPDDYAFVREGMERLKRAAPKLARMLTEQVEPELTGAVDIWCPVTSSYSQEQAQARQAAGERIWWYVCTGPKAPYCTLFTDHPAIELRMWLWQTVKYRVEGILVWQSNYWTSDAAFPPPALQNPWEDAMSYVSGYSYGPGQIGYWGNGDGRFVYPPNRDPGKDRQKHLTGPVDSIRWEMLREGIEDYEYFHLLREEIARAKARKASPAAITAAEKLLEVPTEVCQDMTRFTLDPQPLYRHRERIARAIEGLRR